MIIQISRFATESSFDVPMLYVFLGHSIVTVTKIVQMVPMKSIVQRLLVQIINFCVQKAALTELLNVSQKINYVTGRKIVKMELMKKTHAVSDINKY
jgi:hypothetical protein